MPKGRGTSHRPPSKVQQAKEERQWRAESMVRDAFMQTPGATKQVKQAVKTLTQAEKQIQAGIKVTPKPKKGK